ncbi:hypothetical protein BOX15_Mlig027514g1 [Macrostomum lignano]|uniref:Protein SYS1 homolog n=1 Tax=Macrostomum lignano TaxID=282301 RepID=A0A267EAM1_9PLAT|nr:hypothetical protein BOX15_Mlig027514g1 [Macrostomum lignano]
MGFRASGWDPALIIAQIIAMQSLYYFCLCIWTLATNLFVMQSPSLSQIFSFAYLRFRDTPGKLSVLTCLLNSFTLSAGLLFVVRRTKQCLDFSVTVFVYHLLFTCIYNRAFPTNFVWWLTNSVAAVITTVLGEFLCLRAELQDIPVHTARIDL